MIIHRGASPLRLTLHEALSMLILCSSPSSRPLLARSFQPRHRPSPVHRRVPFARDGRPVDRVVGDWAGVDATVPVPDRPVHRRPRQPLEAAARRRTRRHGRDPASDCGKSLRLGRLSPTNRLSASTPSPASLPHAAVSMLSSCPHKDAARMRICFLQGFNDLLNRRSLRACKGEGKSDFYHPRARFSRSQRGAVRS